MAFTFWAKKAATPIALDGRLRQSLHVLSAAQGGELVLFDLEGERYYTLNEVGSRAWAILASGATGASIVEAIRGEYALPPGVDEERVAGDVARLLADLHAAGLIVADAPASLEEQ
jgi:hypothetical protein